MHDSDTILIDICSEEIPQARPGLHSARNGTNTEL